MNVHIGWKCCKPRVLTFDEFLQIPPCTTGKHSTVDDTPDLKAAPISDASEAGFVRPKPTAATNEAVVPPAPRFPQEEAPTYGATPPPVPESESDDPSVSIPPGTTCRRRGCNAVSLSGGAGSRESQEDCVHHPGRAIFHGELALPPNDVCCVFIAILS